MQRVKLNWLSIVWERLVVKLAVNSGILVNLIYHFFNWHVVVSWFHIGKFRRKFFSHFNLPHFNLSLVILAFPPVQGVGGGIAGSRIFVSPAMSLSMSSHIRWLTHSMTGCVTFCLTDVLLNTSSTGHQWFFHFKDISVTDGIVTVQ